MHDNKYLLYQLKQDCSTRDLRFESLARIQEAGHCVDKGNYNHVYTAPLADDATLESIYARLNLVHPDDLAGHAPSVSDIIVLQRGGVTSAHYVEPVGFTEVPQFMAAPYRYYLPRHPVDIGTFPKTEGGPVDVVDFGKRKRVENAMFWAWGYVTYDAPLTQPHLNHYDLRPASDNPGSKQLSPYQLEAQGQIIGKWENEMRTPDSKRLTWWHSDFGVFVKKEHVPLERIAERYGEIVEAKTRAAQKQAAKKPIAQQLREGAQQAARDNADRPAPASDNKDKEERA